jgi:hypothetical protein
VDDAIIDSRGELVEELKGLVPVVKVDVAGDEVVVDERVGAAPPPPRFSISRRRSTALRMRRRHRGPR